MFKQDAKENYKEEFGNAETIIDHRNGQGKF